MNIGPYILVRDPVYGDNVHLPTLAERHGLPEQTVRDRHKRGKEGFDLIAPIDQRKRIGGLAAAAKRRA